MAKRLPNLLRIARRNEVMHMLVLYKGSKIEPPPIKGTSLPSYQKATTVYIGQQREWSTQILRTELAQKLFSHSCEYFSTKIL